MGICGKGSVVIKKKFVVSVRLTETEYKDLCRQAEQDLETHTRAGAKNLSAYARKCILKGMGRRNELELKRELKNLAYQVRKIGVNINQVTKKLNGGYGAWGETAVKLQGSMSRIQTEFRKLRDRMEKEMEDGSGDHKDNEH